MAAITFCFSGTGLSEKVVLVALVARAHEQGAAHFGGGLLEPAPRPVRRESLSNSSTRDTGQQSTVVAHVFWSTNLCVVKRLLGVFDTSPGKFEPRRVINPTVFEPAGRVWFLGRIQSVDSAESYYEAGHQAESAGDAACNGETYGQSTS